MTMDEPKRPLPAANAEDAPFWQAAREHRLVLPRCTACGFSWFPPYASCTRCASPHIEWIPASGRGTLWGWIEMHQPYLPYFRKDLPYNVVLVRLEEGVFLYSNLAGEVRYEDLRAGLPLEVVFDDVGEFTLPKFRLLKNGVRAHYSAMRKNGL